MIVTIINVLYFLCSLSLSISSSAAKNERMNRYDLFHPSGRVLQLEYAKQAVFRKGGPIAAIRCLDGVLIVAARVTPRSSLHLQSDRKIFFVNSHTCVAVTGLIFDANAIIDFMKKRCTEYEIIYDCPIPLEVLCDDTSNILHSMTLKGDTRPLAVNLIVSGIDSILGPQIYSIDMAGTFDEWKAVAVGVGEENIMSSLADITTDKMDTLQNTWKEFKSKIIKKFFADEKTRSELKDSLEHSNAANNETQVNSNVWDVEVSEMQ